MDDLHPAAIRCSGIARVELSARPDPLKQFLGERVRSLDPKNLLHYPDSISSKQRLLAHNTMQLHCIIGVDA
jgi:hypothetical protein